MLQNSPMKLCKCFRNNRLQLALVLGSHLKASFGSVVTSLKRERGEKNKNLCCGISEGQRHRCDFIAAVEAQVEQGGRTVAGCCFGFSCGELCSGRKIQSDVHLLSFLPFNLFAYHDSTNPLSIFCIHFSNNQ